MEKKRGKNVRGRGGGYAAIIRTARRRRRRRRQSLCTWPCVYARFEIKTSFDPSRLSVACLFLRIGGGHTKPVQMYPAPVLYLVFWKKRIFSFFQIRLKQIRFKIIILQDEYYLLSNTYLLSN